MSEAAIKDAMETAHQFLSDTAQRRAYVNRLMAVLDYNTGIENAREEGKAETAIAMLRDKMAPEKVAHYTGLSLEKIQKIAKENQIEM